MIPPPQAPHPQASLIERQVGKVPEPLSPALEPLGCLLIIHGWQHPRVGTQVACLPLPPLQHRACELTAARSPGPVNCDLMGWHYDLTPH